MHTVGSSSYEDRVDPYFKASRLWLCDHSADLSDSCPQVPNVSKGGVDSLGVTDHGGADHWFGHHWMTSDHLLFHRRSHPWLEFNILSALPQVTGRNIQDFLHLSGENIAFQLSDRLPSPRHWGLYVWLDWISSTGNSSTSISQGGLAG